MLHRVKSALGELMHAETQSKHCLRIHNVNIEEWENLNTVCMCVCV